jgi:cyclohexadienyl dehydratase
VVFLLPLPAQTRTLAAIKGAGILRIGLTGDYPPYALRDTDGSLTGADVVMAQALAKELGVTLKIVPTT